MLSLPYPTCAKCSRPVDTFTIEPTQHHHIRKLTARCHGEVETCEIDLTQFDPGASIVKAVAFKPKEGEIEWKK